MRTGLTILLLITLTACGGGDDDKVTDAPPDGVTQEGEGPIDEGPPPAPPPMPEFAVGECLVYSEPAGCAVYLDGYPVMDAAGSPAVTPCAITAGEGRHTVTLVQPPHIDSAHEVRFSADEPATIEVVLTDVPEGASLMLDSPYATLRPGEPVELTSLNSPAMESDPQLSPDGRVIWFVSDRFEGKGVYMSVRASPLDEFPPPELQSLSRSREGAASPSLMDDGSVVFLAQEAARAWQLVRPSPLAPFSDKIPLVFNDEEDARWVSGQISADGLRFYFTQSSDEELHSRVFVRDDATAAFEEDEAFNMPGIHPRLSADGLRQYVYDGQTLSRARRESEADRFSSLETVCEVALDNFVPSDTHRQYCISDDEQWIIYSDNPGRDGDLYLARLSTGVQWGPAIVARAIEPRELVAATDAEEMEEPGPELFDPDNPPPVETQPEETVPDEPEFDPLLVNYEAHRERTSEIFRTGDIELARLHINFGLDSPDLAGVAEALRMDLEDADVIEAFWDLVDAGAATLSAGSSITVDRIDHEVVSYSERTFQALRGSEPREIKLHELDYTQILELAERSMDPGVERGWLLLLLATPDYPARSRERQLSESEDGVQLMEREASRLLIRARDAIDRRDLAFGLQLLDQLEASYPDSPSAAGVAELRNAQYDAVMWNVVGPRQWERGELGEWTAGTGRSEGSWLQSPEPYSRFQLSMEYRTNAQLGQGGVVFRYDGEGRIDRETFRIQLSNDEGLTPDVYCTGSLFGVERPSSNMAGPQGEWNTFLMEVDGEELKVTINGEVVLDTLAVENAVPLSGYVVLDGVTGGISYRKVVLTGEP